MYTVDEHILMVIRNLRRLVLPRFDPRISVLPRTGARICQPEVLYLAALFHDIAKGRGGDHSELGKSDARVCQSASRFRRPDIDLVAWLVENHLRMSSVAQNRIWATRTSFRSLHSRRDDERRLTARYLLTVADVRTSPHVEQLEGQSCWNSCFRATRAAARRRGEQRTLDCKQRKPRHLRLPRRPGGKQSQLWYVVDESYFQRFDADEMAW